MKGVVPQVRRARRGFGLVELMIALAVVALALLAILSLVLATARAKEARRELRRAKEAATRKLEELKAQPWAALADPASPAYAPFAVEGLSDPSTPDRKARGTVRVLHAGTPLFNPNLVDVEVRVRWRGAGGESTYAARSMMTR